jgi:hypothetical protein
MNKTEMAKMEKDYQADSDLATLIEARKIQADKTRLAAAMKCRKEKMTALQSLEQSKGA